MPSGVPFTDASNTFQQTQTLAQGIRLGATNWFLGTDSAGNFSLQNGTTTPVSVNQQTGITGLPAIQLIGSAARTACASQSEGLVQYINGTTAGSGFLQVCENQSGSYAWTPLISASQASSAAPVQSVAGRINNITLTHSDITDWNMAIANTANTGAINTDLSIANIGTQYSVGGLTDVMSLACGVSINDGHVHTIGNAPTGSCFSGISTLSGLASVVVNGTTPFSWVTQQKAPFSFSASQYNLTDASVPKMDIAWLAIQTALLGGKTYVPGGTYIIGSSEPLPLYLPSGIESGGTTGGTYTTLAGDGPRTSMIKAGYDWGTGFHLLICGDPTGTVANGVGRYGGNNFPGDVRGIGFFSSASSVLFPMGAVNINMDGFGWGARLRMQDVEVSGFNHDLTIVGDHTAFIRVHLNGGAMGVYLTEPSLSNTGDLEFVDLVAAGQSQAAIGVSKHATLSAVFDGETYLAAPYSILGEASTDGSCASIANSVQFDRLMAEYTGNAFVSDDTAYSNGVYTDQNKCRDFSKVWIKDFFMSWNNGTFWGGPGQRQRRAAVDVRAMSMTVNNLECDSGCWTPASVAVPSGSTLVATVNLSQAPDVFGSNMVRGAVQNWIGRSGTLPLVAGTFGPMYESFSFESQNEAWGGFIDSASTQGATYSTYSSGDVVQYRGAFYYAGGGATSDLQPPAGICVQNGVSTAAYIPILTHGRQNVNIASQNPQNGPWKMGTGIGPVTIANAGSGGTNGTYNFVSSGGGCTTQPAGTFTVANGAVSTLAITNYGSGCSSAPALSTSAAPGLAGAVLTPKWPAAIAVPAASWADNFVLGTGRNGSVNANGNSIAIALKGLR